jgi:restriction system protein
MPRYWIIAPMDSNPADVFEATWQFDLSNDVISIGWEGLGDISSMSRDKLSQCVAAAFPDKPLGTKTLFTNMLWTFYHVIAPGDTIIARRGRKAIAGVGTVTKAAVYAPKRNPAIQHASFLEVKWDTAPRDKTFPAIVFPMHTVAEASAEHRSLVGDAQSSVQPPSEGVEDPAAFVLERYLEDFIVSNFDTIFKGRLRIYKDSEGNEGQQYTTDIGPIDILAIDKETNRFVVIELKKGRPSDQVIGQILRYMGWVKKMLCKNDQAVEGLIICRDPDSKLSFALEMTNNINVRYYSVSFKLRENP